ncbi:MAG: prepilin-type N-terminal cleavage/methylation domain-containing protein [Oscillospiraceae bacterium]
MRKLLNRKNKKGFTLVELVIVIAVLAILACIAIPTVSNVVNKANAASDSSNAQAVTLALKTASAQYQAGNWNGAAPGGADVAYDAVTVTNALAHSGITALPAAKRSGSVWEYDDGVAYCAPTVTGRTTLAGTTLLDAVLPD